MNALKGADKDSFEVAFHEVERRLLAGGCVRKVTNQNTPSGHVTTILTSDWRKVIKLMKFLRDTKGGTVSQLKSHYLKVDKAAEE